MAVFELWLKADHGLMRRVNRWRAPRWLRLWMVAATRGGDGALWWATGAYLAFFGGPVRFAALLSTMLAIGIGIGLFVNLKRGIGRRRPCAIEPHVWSTLLPPDQFSFPSGHTITAFAATVSLAGFYPHAIPGLLFVACSIALSRILLGMHFLTDVLAGAAIGTALGLGSASLIRALAG